jgi:hypothetical protein
VMISEWIGFHLLHESMPGQCHPRERPVAKARRTDAAIARHTLRRAARCRWTTGRPSNSTFGSLSLD